MYEQLKMNKMKKMKTSKIIWVLVLMLISTVMYSQKETHVYDLYAYGTTDNILNVELQETYSVMVVDWDKSIISLDGTILVIGDSVLIRSIGVLEFDVYARDGEVMRTQLTNGYLLIKDNQGKAIIYIKSE